jgi:hypothetical protein
MANRIARPLDETVWADGPRPMLLKLACRTRVVSEQGSHIIDDTLMPKPFAAAIEGLACAFQLSAPSRV